MKKYFLLFTLLFSLFTIAQRNNLVEYQFIHKSGTNEKEHEYLIFNDSDLFYMNLTNKDNLNFEDARLNKTKINLEEIYINLKTDSLYQQRLGMKDNKSTKVDWFLLAEEVPSIKWSLKKDSQKILGYTTYKAIANFRGRDYIVWYAPDIPVNHGPWKLNGLPGLILKAETDLFSYEATRIVLNSDSIKYFVNWTEKKI